MAVIEDSNLLNALRPRDMALLRDHVQPVNFRAGDVLFEAGDVVKQAFFPTARMLVSFVVHLEDGKEIETALIGREGAVGGIVSEGRLPAYCRAVVQYGGLAYRIEAARLEHAKAESLTLRHLFARYADCLLAQIFQSVACNAAHSIERRAARWLIAAVERTDDREVTLNQEQLAATLGVGRSYVSRVIGQMKARGLLETRRGGLIILDTAALRQCACDCNDLVRAHFDDVLAGVYPAEGLDP